MSTDGQARYRAAGAVAMIGLRIVNTPIGTALLFSDVLTGNVAVA
jgi:hypothetical protein